MQRLMFVRVWLARILVGMCVSSFGHSDVTGDLVEARAVIESTHTESASVEKQINQLSAEAQETVADYLANQRRADVIEAYNAQLKKLIQAQEQEQLGLLEQIESITDTERAVLPMLNTLVDELEHFVSGDTPFLPEEREQRIARLQKLLERADISVAEKYRQILEAYQVEVEYGRTLEAYRGRLIGQASGSEPSSYVTYLRIGRMALYYQSLDGLQSALWRPQQERWQVLTDAQNLAVSQAIQVARQERVPELLDLPVPQLAEP